MKLIVGLGNPGIDYRHTRHNIGFMVVDKLAERYTVQRENRRFDAIVGDTAIEGEKVLLVKPLTFMNRSGQAVGPVFRWYKLALKDMIVVYDDLDLPPGRLRLRLRGSAGGHKGMASVIQLLDTQDICRIRIGIGRPSQSDAVPWVLGKIPAADAPLAAAVERAADALVCWCREGMIRAMNTYNG
jgi:PTH1 family peptidyl-tRNA hydrolase